MTNDEAERLALQMARAIWKQMNFRGGDPTREWDSLTPDMQQPIIDSCRVGLEAVHREIENAAFRRALSRITNGTCDSLSEAEDRIRALVVHASDCAMNNAPALPVGPCDCGALIQPPAPTRDSQEMGVYFQPPVEGVESTAIFNTPTQKENGE